MQSWDTRRRWRGGLTQPEFLLAMQREGFRLMPSSLPNAPRLMFDHPLAPGRTFAVNAAESFAAAVTRMKHELHNSQHGTPTP